MSYNNRLPAKFDPTPKKHHGWTFLIFLFGILLPPIAVAARFGIGSDFFLNCFLCICGYIPSHGHNFYIQNIRNNDGRKRTPKWIKKAGLVDDSEDQRRAARSQWAKRYDERLPNSTLDDADLAEGEEGGNYVPSRTIDEEEVARRRREGLWTNEEEEYYNEERRDAAPNQQHWHYPANFEGSEAAPPKFHLPGSKSKSSKKRTDASAYAPKSNNSADRPWDAQFDDDVPEWGREYGSGGAGSGANAGRGASQRRSTLGSDDGYGGGVGNGSARTGGNKRDSARVGGGRSEREEDWNHQF